MAGVYDRMCSSNRARRPSLRFLKPLKRIRGSPEVWRLRHLRVFSSPGLGALLFHSVTNRSAVQSVQTDDPLPADLSLSAWTVCRAGSADFPFFIAFS